MQVHQRNVKHIQTQDKKYIHFITAVGGACKIVAKKVDLHETSWTHMLHREPQLPTWYVSKKFLEYQ